MAAAGVPGSVGFATKLVQAEQILARRIAAGQVPTALAGDAVYGRTASRWRPQVGVTTGGRP
jgi:hypothetical protein